MKVKMKNENKKPLEYTVLIIRRALDKIISYTNEYKKQKQKWKWKQKTFRIYCTYIIRRALHKIISYTNKLPTSHQHMLLMSGRGT